jgi:hypothetical protein
MKLSKYFKKWFLPISILMLLVIVICYSLSYFIHTFQFKEGATNCNLNIPKGVSFHGKINYAKFDRLARSNHDKKIFGTAFSILNSYIKTLSGKENQLESKSIIYELSKDKQYLKITIPKDRQYLYKIENSTLSQMSTCSLSDSFSTIKEGLTLNTDQSIDVIELTKKDFNYFINNPLVDLPSSDIGYNFMNDQDNCFSITNALYGNNSKCLTTGVFKQIIQTLDASSSLYFCTASKEPTDCSNGQQKYPNLALTLKSNDIKNQDNTPAQLVVNDSKNVTLLKNGQFANQALYALNYILKTKLQTTVVKDPYSEFSLTHDKINDFANNVISILTGNSSNKIYGWIGTST